MIELKTSPRSTLEQLNTQIKLLRIGAGQYVRITTPLPNFNPIFLYTIESLINPNNKQSIQNVQQQAILKYGSQLYLKTQPKNNFIHEIQPLKNHSITQYSTIFFEIMMNNQYLTKRENNSIQLIQQNTKEGFWAIYQTSVYQYHIYNISSDSYLSMGSNGWEIHKNKNQNCSFEIRHSSYDTFILIPQKCPSSIFQPIEITLFPVQNSVINLFFELKYSEQVLKSAPTSKRISQIIQELIYFKIPQFGHNQKLLSSPIQKILLEVGISKLILEFLCSEIHEKEYVFEVAQVISNDVKLICQDNKENSLIFRKLINIILSSQEYNLYLDSLIQLVHENWYFINSFQSQGWSKNIIKKLQFLATASELEEVQTFQKLMFLVSEFCNKNYSIPNKYLVMHTFEQTQNRNDKKVQQTEQNQQKIWSRYFDQGQYVFVEVQNEASFVEIELQTFLSKDIKNRLRYLAQINMIGKFCSGLNVNAVNKYNQILKYISSYCYNENFPRFDDQECKEKTIEAISACFDWTTNERMLQNSFNISLVFNPNEANIENTWKQKNYLKGKADQFKNLRHNSHREYQTFIDILKNLVNAFQKQVQKYLIRIDRRQAEILDIFIPKSTVFSGRLLNWIKIVQISLGARLIPIMKHKIGPYAEYFKKIFEKNPKSKQKQKSLTPIKRQLDKKSPPLNITLTTDNEYQTQITLILDFLIRLVKYNPIYSMYLREIKIKKDNARSKEKFIEKVFNSRKSANLSRQFTQNSIEKPDFNKIICMNELITDETQKKQMKEINLTKLYCYRSLSLIYQNIIEEQVQYQVRNLSSLQKSSKLSTNIDLEEGLKKFSFTDQSFRLSLIQNWYLISNPEVLDSATTCLKYIYGQQQIYIRHINNTFLLFSKQNMHFYNSIQNFMEEINKLALTIETWFSPQILLSQQSYYDNYTLFERSFQGVNNQIKKLNISDIHDLEDYQEILEKMGLLESSLSTLNHLKEFFNKNIKNLKKGHSEASNGRKESSSLLDELIKILQFYVHFNENNKKKVIILLGQAITSTVYTFPFFIFMMRQSKSLQLEMNLISRPMLLNVKDNLPQTKEFLELVLILEPINFIKIVNELSLLLTEKAENDQNNMEKSIISDCSCFHSFCKMAYKIISIGNCGYLYLSWFYNFLFFEFLEKEVSSNVHFKTKMIENLETQMIYLSSSVSYLIFWFYKHQEENTKKIHSIRQQKFKKEAKLKSIQGIRMISNFIVIQLLASVLQTNSTLLKIYIEYYLHDLIPLLQFCDPNFLSSETKKIISERSENYLTVYEQGTGLMKSHSLNVESPIPKMAKKGSFNIEIDQRSFKLEELNKEKKMKQVKNYLTYQTIPSNFFPRHKSLLAPNRPQVSKQRKSMNEVEEREQKEDEFTKMSKKAMKIWYKARHKLNQKRESLIVRDKFIEDINKLSSQYDLQEKERELVINSADIIAKSVSIIVHSSYINLCAQNQIFILKNILLWLKQRVDERDKMKAKNLEDNKYLIKRFQISTIVIQILQQLSQSISTYSNKCKNIFQMCYQLKLLQMLTSMLSSNVSNSVVVSIASLIVKITSPLTNLYYLHKQLLSQYEISKSQQKCELIERWIPLNIHCDFVLQFVSVVGIGAQQWGELCYVFLENSVLIQKNEKVGFEDILSTFKNANNERYENVRKKLIRESDIFEAIELLC